MVRVDDPYKKFSADGDVSGGPSGCTVPLEGAAAQTGPKGFRIIGRTSTGTRPMKMRGWSVLISAHRFGEMTIEPRNLERPTSSIDRVAPTLVVSPMKTPSSAASRP